MNQSNLITTFALLLLFAGCGSPSYSIRVVDGFPKETYLTFSKGAQLNVGDVFVLFHVQQPPPPSIGRYGGHSGHGSSGTLSLKHEIGKVQVIKMADETHALVKVLSGYVEDGVKAEKVERENNSRGEQ